MAVRRWIALVAMAVLVGGVPVTTLAQEEEEQPTCASICWEEEDACIAQCGDEDEACAQACTDAGDACREDCGEEEE